MKKWDTLKGTSTKTPTTVTKAAGDCNPKSAIATATASSKKLLAPIIAAGAQIGCGRLSFLPAIQVIKNIKYVCKIKGMATKSMMNGLLMIFCP